MSGLDQGTAATENKIKSASVRKRISMVGFFWFETFGFSKTVGNCCG